MRSLGRITLLAGAGIIVSTALMLAGGQAAAPGAGRAAAPAPARPAAAAPAPQAAARPAASNAMPRTPEGHPDFSGVWQSLSSAGWDLQDHQSGLLGNVGFPPGRGVVEGGTIPYKPDALKQKQMNYAMRDTEDPGLAKCLLPGIPRATYMPYPFEINQSPTMVGFQYAFARAQRRVDMTGRSRDWLKGWPDFWMGDSRGSWAGDTLVLDVRKLDENAWLDHAGDWHTENAHVVERFTPIDRDHIQYEATIEDPDVYTRPWKIALPLYRIIDKNFEIQEWDCRYDQDSAKYKDATPK
jgi:hypothetical protein